jgi:hydroxymethylpyrimidine/phosphomethylpyrimidine kinase
MKTALTIAGSDPTGGAGIQLDIKVFQTFDVHGLSAITAITAQNTASVKSINPVESNVVKHQIDVLLEDIRVDAVKIGMLYRKSVANAVSTVIRENELRNVVLDPIMIASSGATLIEEGLMERMVDVLFPLIRVITPNMHEASLISGIMIENLDDVYSVAEKIKSLGPEIVIITGGHHDILNSGMSRGMVTDFYYDGKNFFRIESKKHDGEYHGTGCAFSSALTALLACEKMPLDAARIATQFVSGSLNHAYSLGYGMRILGIE